MQQISGEKQMFDGTNPSPTIGARYNKVHQQYISIYYSKNKNEDNLHAKDFLSR